MGQCGGFNYNGIKICQDWLTCVKDTDWYFQCKKIEKSTNKPLPNNTASISPTMSTTKTSFFSTKTSTLTFFNSNNGSTLMQTSSSLTSNNIILTSITKSVYKTEVAIYGQCGGIDYSGSIVCDSSSICVYSNPYYSQCLPKPNEPNKINEWGQCGGLNYNGIKICQDWLT
ncbi:unnamed protein product, partial [Brachionus calyciflorus]